MNKLLNFGAVAALVAVSAFSTPAVAGPAFDRVSSTGRINVGVRESAPPFASMGADGQPRGYSVDICARVIKGMEKELKRTLTVQYHPVNAKNRLELIKSGAIDMECGTTTHTVAREKEVAFSFPFFITGIRIAVQKGAAIRDYGDMRGSKVAVVTSSTAEKILKDVNTAATLNGRGFTLVAVENNNDGVKAVAAGRVDAFATDDVLLSGAISANKLNGKVAAVGRFLSVEPYAIVAPLGDKEFLALIDNQLTGIYRNGEAVQLISKWFGTPEMNYPVNYMTREAMTLPVKQAAYP